MRTFTEDEALAFVQNMKWGGAAGSCKDGRLARRYAQAGMKIVPYGSVRNQMHPGNPGDNWHFDEQSGNSINALGIPDKGLDVHLAEGLADTRTAVNMMGAELWASITANEKVRPEDYGDMARDLDERNAADVVEANYSCGNMLLDGIFKPIICYDLGLFDACVEAHCSGAGTKKKAAKLTPTTERKFLLGNVDICLKHGIDYIVLANTIPNSYLEKSDGTPAVHMLRGGLGGRALIPIVTGMIQMVKPALQGTGMKIIAAGGVGCEMPDEDCGKIAYHYLKHGADGFVFGTALWRRNFDPRVGQEIMLGEGRRKGLVQLLAESGLPD